MLHLHEKCASGDFHSGYGWSKLLQGFQAKEIVPPSRNMSLDMLRGTAALLVLVRHVPKTESLPHSVIENIFQWAHSIGWIGVDLFFVMSGFLISKLIYEEYDATNGFAAKRFLIRRSFKIWPVYFLGF